MSELTIDDILNEKDPFSDETESSEEAVETEEVSAETPAVDAEADEGAEVEEPAPILSKSGTYTIPFAKLEEAREEAKRLKEELEQLRTQMSSAQVAEVADRVAEAKAEDAQTGTTEAMDDLLSTLREEWGDDTAEALVSYSKAQMDPLRAENAELRERLARMESELQPIRQRMVQTDMDRHFAAIEAKYPDFEEQLESAEFAAWRAAQPSYVQASIDAIIRNGSAEQGIELLDNFSKATEPAKTVDVAAKAEEVVSKAKGKGSVPRSLTDFPAGTKAPIDDKEAFSKKSPLQLMDELNGKTPEQIWEYYDRVI